jgi:hypothetical protein
VSGAEEFHLKQGTMRKPVETGESGETQLGPKGILFQSIGATAILHHFKSETLVWQFFDSLLDRVTSPLESDFMVSRRDRRIS